MSRKSDELRQVRRRKRQTEQYFFQPSKMVLTPTLAPHCYKLQRILGPETHTLCWSCGKPSAGFYGGACVRCKIYSCGNCNLNIIHLRYPYGGGEPIKRAEFPVCRLCLEGEL